MALINTLEKFWRKMKLLFLKIHFIIAQIAIKNIQDSKIGRTRIMRITSKIADKLHSISKQPLGARPHYYDLL